MSQLKDSAILVLSNLANKFFRFSRQLILAFFLGVSGEVDLLLVAQILPTIFLSIVGGAGGETLVTLIKNDKVDLRVAGLFMAFLQLVSLLFLATFFGLFHFLTDIFALEPGQSRQYAELSWILLFNVFPGVIVSVATPLLYLNKNYKYYAITTIVSEVVGLGAIFLLVPLKGILAFPLGTLVTSLLNMFLFLGRLQLDFKIFLRPGEWRELGGQLKSIFTRMGIVSGQTLVNYLGTFWDRSFGVRFLHEGYLSALNYATTLFELPNLVYNKSIGTTTYINQLKYSQDSKSKFEDYSRKIFKLTAVTAMVGQLLFVVLAPAFIIILYRRGKFDNDSVAGTLVILEILAMGLAPTVLLLFGSRMLYALQSFKQVFGAVFFRILIKISLITTLISVVPNILPISTTLTAYFAFIYVFVVVARITGIRFLSPGFLLAFAALLLLNLLAVFLNSHYFEYYLDAPIALIVIFAALVALLGGLGLWIFASKSGFLAILKKN